eukprot:386057-Prymnesium_polylepis.1
MEKLGMDTTGLKFVQMDIDDPQSVAAAVAGRSLCIHTAGPFQQREDPALLSACIDAGIPYCDGAATEALPFCRRRRADDAAPRF